MKSQTATKNLLMSVLLVGSTAGPAAHACSDDAAAILLCFTVGFFYPECNDAKLELVKRALTPFVDAIPEFDECSIEDPNAPAGLEYPDVKIVRNPAAYVPDAGDEETPPENPSPAELNTAGNVFRVSNDQVFVDDMRCLIRDGTAEPEGCTTTVTVNYMLVDGVQQGFRYYPCCDIARSPLTEDLTPTDPAIGALYPATEIPQEVVDAVQASPYAGAGLAIPGAQQ